MKTFFSNVVKNITKWVQVRKPNQEIFKRGDHQNKFKTTNKWNLVTPFLFIFKLHGQIYRLPSLEIENALLDQDKSSNFYLN